MDSRLLSALYAKPAPFVLGRRLRPFSLAHRVALTALGSPFVEQDKPIDEAALLVAVKVCGSPHPLAASVHPDFRDKREFWRMRFAHTRFLVGCREFVAYMADHTAHPELWEKEQKAAGDGIPWPLHIVARLVRNGVPLAEAWHMSEGAAVWLAITFSRQEGADLSVITERERLAMTLLDAATKSPAHG